jgi:hypothetical protein
MCIASPAHGHDNGRTTLTVTAMTTGGRDSVHDNGRTHGPVIIVRRADAVTARALMTVCVTKWGCEARLKSRLYLDFTRWGLRPWGALGRGLLGPRWRHRSIPAAILLANRSESLHCGLLLRGHFWYIKKWRISLLICLLNNKWAIWNT